MNPDIDHVTAVARALAGRAPVDWDAVDAESTDTEREAVRELKVIAEIAALHHASETGAVPDGRWGPLRILERVGHGAYGDVYRALDPQLDREVALKLLRQSNEPTEVDTAAIDEARLLARVRHPNVVTIHGADRIDGRTGLWMEFVRGRTLEELLQDIGPLPVSDIVRICVDVCSALAAVHDAGLLHRDVKAQNVMRDEHGRHVLMDFGAGRRLELSNEADLTGTPLYLAPEVLNGQNASPQSDVYSVGVLLFHLLTGKYPVEGRAIEELRARHAAGGPVDIQTVRPDCPDAPRALIHRALSRRPDDRFETAASMAEAASAIADATSRYRPAFRWILTVSILAAALAGTSWWLAGAAGTNDNSVRTRLLWDDAVDLTGTTTTDGRFLSFADWETGNLAVRDLVAGHTTTVTKGGFAAGGQVEHSVFSPDGKQIAYTSWLSLRTHEQPAHYELRVIGVDGTGERTLRRGDAERTYWQPQAWSPDGEWIAAIVATGRGFEIERVSANGAGATTLAAPDNDPTTSIRVAPDGRWVAFQRQRQATIAVVRADGSSSTPRQITDAARLLAWTSDGRILFTRDRNGSTEVYALPVADGRATGGPARLDAVADMGPALGFTAGGALIYAKTKTAGPLIGGIRSLATDAISIAIDPSTGGLGPEQVMQAVTAYGFGGQAGGVRSSPDGTRLLYAPTPGTIVIRSLDGSGTRTLVPGFENLGRIEWAGDGRSLIVNGNRTAGERGVFRLELETGRATLLVPRAQAGGNLTAHVSSPDGQTIYLGSGFEPKVTVVAHDLATGSQRQIRTPSRTAIRLSVSRDGRRLAIVSFGVIEFVDLSSGTTTRIVGNPEDAQFWGGDWSADGKSFYATVSYGTIHPRGELWTIPVAGGEPTRRSLSAPARGGAVPPRWS